ncbi:MAG: hypothetical protein K0S58_1915, partial [Nitrospira sp.]|nr:hypothetical protein [Nitrospira sp.]
MSMMRFRNPRTDREAEPGALFGMGPRVVGAKETIENLFVRVLRNADAVIAHGETYGLAFHAKIDFHPALWMRVFHRIVDDVQNELPQSEFVASDRRRLN